MLFASFKLTKLTVTQLGDKISQWFFGFYGFKIPMQTVAQIGDTISYVGCFGYAGFKVPMYADSCTT